MFDPKLQANFAFNQPTGAGPSLIGTIGGLVGDFLNVEADLNKGRQASTPKLTEDEKFAQDFSVFVDSKKGSFELDTKSVREFAWKYPQHSDKIFKHAENLGVLVKPPEELAIEKGIERYADEPGFMMVVAEAQSKPEEEREAHIMGYIMEQEQSAAEIKKIERDKARLEAEGSLSTKKWEAIGGVQKRMADATVSTILEPILQDISSGLTVELSPEEQAQLGVRYNKVDMTNIGAVLRDTRRFLETQSQDAYYSAFGEDSFGLPPKEWDDRVFGGIDALIDVVDQFDSPTERLNALNALIETGAVTKLDKAGLSTATWMLKNMPPNIADRYFTDPDVMGRFQEIFTLDERGEVVQSDISGNADSMSKAEASKLAADTMDAISKGGGSYEMFTAFAESAKRSGYGVVDGPTFTQMVGNSSDWMKSKAAEDPDAKMYMQEWFVSDINQTVTFIGRNLPANLTLTYSGGKYVASLTVAPVGQSVSWESLMPSVRLLLLSSLESLTEEQYISEQLRGLPSGLNVDDLNKKLSALKTLGPMGQEVIDVVIGNKFEPKAKAEEAAKNAEASPTDASFTVTKSEKNVSTEISYDYTTSNGKIAQNLGIDFGSYEAQYGLPAGFLEKTAFIESRGNPNAKNPSSTAGGLFQQINSNAKEWGVTDKFDPIQSTEGAAKFAASNAKYLRKVLGREPTGGELYLAHQQGPGGAAKLLGNSNALAVDIVGADAVELNGGNLNMTAGEFANIWISKYNGQRGATSYAPTAAGETSSSPIDISPANVDTQEAIVGAGNVEAGAGGNGGTIAPLASPEVEKMIVESGESEALKQRAMEILSRKNIDKDVAELIKALVGGS